MKKFMSMCLPLLIALANAAAMAYYLAPFAGETVPVHFGINGQPDRFGSIWNVAILAAIPILLAVFYILYRLLAKNNENIKRNVRYENVVIPFIIYCMTAICWVYVLALVSYVNGGSFSDYVPGILALVFGILGLVMSNIMPKVKPNKTFGIRTYATLSDERAWRAAHRLCGYTGAVGSLLLLAGGVVCFSLPAHGMYIALGCLAVFIILIGVVPSIYASRLYKKHKAEAAETKE